MSTPRSSTSFSRVGVLWNRYFFKKRDLLAFDASQFQGVDVPHSAYETLSVAGGSGATIVPLAALQQLAAQVGTERLEMRMAHEDLSLFLAITESGELAGYMWALHPFNTPRWHDYVRIAPRSALVFNVYVLPHYRRSGVFLSLLRYSSDYLLNNLGSTRLLAVIESSNAPSRRAFSNFGFRAVGTNYLVKVLGRNVVTITKDEGSNRAEVHFAYRNSKSHTF